MKYKVFYHGTDLDGVCSAAIIKHFFKNIVVKPEYYPIDYNDPFPWNDISKNDIIYMVDFSLEPFNQMEKLFNSVNHLVWIEHHKTAIEAYSKSDCTIYGIQRTGRGACELTWEYFFPNKPLPFAIELLSNYDVWNHSNVNTLPFQYGMKSLDWNLNSHVWDLIINNDFRFRDSIITKGRGILDYIKEENKQYAERYAYEDIIDGYRVIIINRGNINSKLFDSVYNPEKHDLMMIYCKKKDLYYVTLYSDKPDVDVSKVAEKYGGGGHAGAAGFTCITLPLESTKKEKEEIRDKERFIKINLNKSYITNIIKQKTNKINKEI